jgi:hypothetical protein
VIIEICFISTLTVFVTPSIVKFSDKNAIRSAGDGTCGVREVHLLCCRCCTRPGLQDNQFSYGQRSVADRGCLSRILSFVHPGYWISDPGSKNSNIREGRKKSCSAYFCCHKNHKIENYINFELVKQKILVNLQSRDPRSGKTYSGSGIQGSKRHLIPDPDAQHWVGA